MTKVDAGSLPYKDFLAVLGFTPMQMEAKASDGTPLPQRPPISINGMEHGTLDPIYCGWVRPLEGADTGFDVSDVFLFIYQTDEKDNVAAFMLQMMVARGVVKGGLLVLDQRDDGPEGGEE